MTADTMDAAVYALWELNPNRPILSVPELHAGLVASTEVANQVWAEWVQAGRPVEHPYGRADNPAGWWGHVRRAELYALALEAARWQVACTSWRWRTGQVAPNPRAVLAVRASSAVTPWSP